MRANSAPNRQEKTPNALNQARRRPIEWLKEF